MTTRYASALSINRLRLAVNLGETAGEREKAQPVDVDVKLFFPANPQACADDGEEFLCYDALCSEIIQFTSSREFRLIEFLTLEMYALVKQHVAKKLPGVNALETRIWLRIHKCVPPVPQILGGTSFTYTDLPEGLHEQNA